jgi:hypothetical protein
VPLGVVAVKMKGGQTAKEMRRKSTKLNSFRECINKEWVRTANKKVDDEGRKEG